MSTRAEFPAFLDPLAALLWASPEVSSIAAKSIRLGEATVESREIPDLVTLAGSGSMSAADAEELFGRALSDGPQVMSGRLPIQVTNETDGTRSYRFVLEGPLHFEVPRTSGLFLDVRPIEDGRIAFSFAAPEGAFTSEGCTPVPGTLIPPGYYVEDARTASGTTYRVYEREADRLLERTLVDAEMTVLATNLPKE